MWVPNRLLPVVFYVECVLGPMYPGSVDHVKALKGSGVQKCQVGERGKCLHTRSCVQTHIVCLVVFGLCLAVLSCVWVVFSCV